MIEAVGAKVLVYPHTLDFNLELWWSQLKSFYGVLL